MRVLMTAPPNGARPHVRTRSKPSSERAAVPAIRVSSALRGRNGGHLAGRRLQVSVVPNGECSPWRRHLRVRQLGIHRDIGDLGGEVDALSESGKLYLACGDLSRVTSIMTGRRGPAVLDVKVKILHPNGRRCLLPGNVSSSAGADLDPGSLLAEYFR